MVLAEHVEESCCLLGLTKSDMEGDIRTIDGCEVACQIFVIGQDRAPRDAEVWLDGGHNPHGAAAVARAVADLEERAEKPLYLISGMLANKDSVGFFSAFRGLARYVITIAIPGEENALGPGALYDRARCAGLEASPGEDVEDAMLQVAAMARMDGEDDPPRILICGSLYLAGSILAENG